MPARFPLDLLKAGMVLKVSIYSDGGLLLSAGTAVSDRHLKQLASWGIAEIETQETLVRFGDVASPPPGTTDVMDLDRLGLAPKQTSFLPPGSTAEDGETYMVEGTIDHVATPIAFEKNVIINGDIAPHVLLSAPGSIRVSGGVSAGARITAGTTLDVLGAVRGTSELPVTLEGEIVTLETVERAVVKAKKTLKAAALRLCHAHAGEEITVTGFDKEGVVGGESEAGSFLRLAAAEGTPESPAVLRVLLLRQKMLFALTSKVTKAIEEKRAEMEQLEKVIEVIRMLGEKVVQLAPEKKAELAAQSKRYMDLKTEIGDLTSKLDRIREETETEIQTINQCPVQIGQIKPGLEIVIGTVSLKLNSRQGATGYFVRSGRIFATSH